MTTYYSRGPPRIEPETTCSGIECVAAGAIDDVLVLLWVGAILAAIAALLYIPRARDTCREERARTRAEATAFDRFARRVSELDADAAPTQDALSRQAPPGIATGSTVYATDGGGLRAVRTAYRETIMSVPHYECEYDESLDENVAGEFDPDIATAVTEGARLTPPMKRTLVERAVDARTRREEFLDVLSDELDALADADRSLRAVESTLVDLNERPLSEQSYDDLEESWYRLRRLREQTETVLEDRQTSIHSGGIVGRRFADSWSVLAYLYQPIAVTHPILWEGTRLLDDVTTAEHRVVQSLTRRV